LSEPQASLFHFPFQHPFQREPEGQLPRARLSLLTFFGEAKKVSGRRATPGKLAKTDHQFSTRQIKRYKESCK
jgi:hypothetical protein